MSSYKITDKDIAAFMEKIGKINIGDPQVFFGELKCLICKRKWTRHNREMVDKYIENGMWYALHELFVVKADHKRFKEYYPRKPTIIQKVELFEKDMKEKADAGILMTEEELFEEARIRGIGIIRPNKPDELDENKLISDLNNLDNDNGLDDEKLLENLICLNKALKCNDESSDEYYDDSSDEYCDELSDGSNDGSE